MMSLSTMSAVLDGKLVGQDCQFASVSNDTRTLGRGALYVAIKGERFDGHDYIDNAAANGAVAAMVDHPVNANIPYVEVSDTKLSLGKLASYWRQQLDIKVAALTGSNGKTTVKEMTASILAQMGKVHATAGNYNNDIGLPLTLLGITPDDDFAVIEMGANHPGEIAYLTEITKPDAAVINNAGAAHLEGFGSLEGVARAKGEIYSGLREDGVAIINLDDQYASYWQTICSQLNQLTFGLNAKADFTATEIQGQSFALNSPIGSCQINLQIPGRHNISNSLASAALASAVGADISAIQKGLNAFAGVKGRLQKKLSACGAVVLDDTYNANPGSLEVAVDVLMSFSGNHYFILGDMRELGDDATSIHEQAGLLIKQKGVECLLTLGELARHAAKSFGEQAVAFNEFEALADYLKSKLTKNDVVAVKGSRGMHMERVVDALVASANNNKGAETCC